MNFAKVILFLVFISIFFSQQNAYAQTNASSEREWSSDYLMGSLGAYQIFGLAARYERMLKKTGKDNMSIGLSLGTGQVLSLQLMPHFTYLLGGARNERHFLEVGAAVPLLLNQEYKADVLVGIATPVGYRFVQSGNKGFTFRVGLSPTIFPQLLRKQDPFDGLAAALYLFSPHISFGYSFSAASVVGGN